MGTLNPKPGQAEKRPQTAQDGEFRQNVQRNLASQLQQLSKQCREVRQGLLEVFCNLACRV